MRRPESLVRDLCISNPVLIPLLAGSIRPRKRFSRLFSVELLILPNTDIHHRGLRGLNWKLPTSEINLNRLAVGIVISQPMLNGSRFYPVAKSSGERLENFLNKQAVLSTCTFQSTFNSLTQSKLFFILLIFDVIRVKRFKK